MVYFSRLKGGIKVVKEQLSSFVNPKIFYHGEYSTIYQVADGRLLKMNSDYLQSLYLMSGISYERKILDTKAHRVSEIVSPLSAVYDKDLCRGFTMEQVKGIDLNQYVADFSLYDKANLLKYAKLYCKIEEAVKKANRLGIVIPDLCTCSNIMIDQDGKIRLVDYDGLQFGPSDKALFTSSVLGDPDQFIGHSKYCKSILSYTAELDKRSLTMLLFLLIFNKDLKLVNQYVPSIGRKIELWEIFDLINLDDEIFMNKVAANLSFDKKGDYLGSDLMRIANNYNMMIYPLPKEDLYAKVLVRK